VDDSISPSTALATRDELFSPDEQFAPRHGFLAGYSGLTREAYALDLRQYATWCTEHRVALFSVRRATSKPPPRVPGPGPGHGCPPERSVVLAGEDC
jgi:hypothetical protein